MEPELFKICECAHLNSLQIVEKLHGQYEEQQKVVESSKIFTEVPRFVLCICLIGKPVECAFYRLLQLSRNPCVYTCDSAVETGGGGVEKCLAECNSLCDGP